MEGSQLVLAFLGVKVATAALFWIAISRGLELGARIEARQRAERERAVAGARDRAAPAEDVTKAA